MGGYLLDGCWWVSARWLVVEWAGVLWVGVRLIGVKWVNGEFFCGLASWNLEPVIMTRC